MQIHLIGLPVAIAEDIVRHGTRMPSETPINWCTSPAPPAPNPGLWVCEASTSMHSQLEEIPPCPETGLIWLTHPYPQTAPAPAGWNVTIVPLPVHMEHLAKTMRQAIIPSQSLRLSLTPDWSLDTTRLQIIHCKDMQPPIVLTEKESALLAALLTHSPQPVAREQLLTTIWGYSHAIDTHTLETHIYRLRVKLASIEAVAEAIRTLPEGYVFQL